MQLVLVVVERRDNIVASCVVVQNVELASGEFRYGFVQFFDGVIAGELKGEIGDLGVR